MEHALLIDSTANLKLWTGEYGRIYFGREFCDGGIPSLREIDTLLEFCVCHKAALTLVTPFCGQAALDRYGEIVEYASGKHPGLEVTVNDWGMVGICRRLGLDMCMGRLLVRQKRDPRIAGIIGDLAPEMRKRFRGTGLNSYVLDVLRCVGIGRIELDNVLQGVSVEDVPDDFSFSLHIPYVFISLTRYCPFSGNRGGGKFALAACADGACGRKTLYNKNLKTALRMRGNAFFYENPLAAEDIDRARINRIIHSL